MKHKLSAAILAALCISAVSCGKEASTSEKKTEKEISSVQESTSASTTVSSVTTTTAAATTKAKTTTATTTAPKPAEPVLLSGTDVVSIYEEVSINSFLTEANVSILNGSELIDTSETGEKSVTVKYSQDGVEGEKKLTYMVEDTEAPIILNSGWNPYHRTGTAFDLNNYVGFADNYDSNPVLTYEGDIDPNTDGDYPLTAYVTDSSGNSTSFDVTISVMNYIPTPPDDRQRVDFSDFASLYGGEGKRVGIDVSTWQGDIDWNAVRDAGCQFAVIRIGYGYNDISMDDRFYANIEGARAAGVDLSVYFYTAANTEDEIIEQARWIAENLNGEALDLPIGFDWEEFGGFQKYGMSIKKLNDLYALFNEEMAAYGYDTMLYSSKNFLNNVWNDHSKSISPVWLAHYVEDTDYDGEYTFWQQSSCGRIPGIYGDVDMNIMYE